MPFLSAKALKKAANNHSSTADSSSVSIAILGYRTTQFLSSYLKASFRLEGKTANIFQGGFGNVEIEILDRESDLYAFEPEVILLVEDFKRLQQKFWRTFHAERAVFATKWKEGLLELITHIRSNSSARIILSTFPPQLDPVFGHFGLQTPQAWSWQVHQMNHFLIELAQEYAGVHVLDMASLLAETGMANVADPSLYLHAKLPWSLDTEAMLAQAYTQLIQVQQGKMKKCLILDLDNTLWGGVIGDDGLQGIKLGFTGVEQAYTDLQRWAKSLKERGILLAVCSKNEEEIAKLPFQQHPASVLSLWDFALFVANWENKADNIRYIQQQLNIGFDSMVFLDDNPAERALIKAELPEVCVPDLPEDPALVLPYVQSLNLFETANFVSTDADRTAQYQAEVKREEARVLLTHLDDFLESLEMKALIEPFSRASAARLAQLSQRSNQFNLRTQRYSEADILQLGEDKNALTLAVSLSDKFGDHGLISMLVGRKQDEQTLFIEHWCMSCRVLKRGVEQMMIEALAQKAREAGFERVIGEYLATNKNGIVRDLYLQLYFQPMEDGRWEMEVRKVKRLMGHIRWEMS